MLAIIIISTVYEKMLSKGESGTKLAVSVRVRQELELPKISKTFPLEQNLPLSEKYEWLVKDKDYASLSIADIEQEYQQLRKQLLLINEEAARNVEKINMKPLKKSRIEQPDKISEIRDKEIENNLAIIARLKYEHEQLQKRAASIETTGKDQLDTSIADTKDQILKLRIKNKQLKLKSKQIGDNIQNGDKVFNEIQMLEMQREMAERKKIKLLERQNEVKTNYEKVTKHLQQISGNSQQAEEFIVEQLESSRQTEEEKKLQSTYRQKNYQLQIVKKNGQSTKNSKQQKYHILLKQLETMVNKVYDDDQRINDSEEANLNQKKQIVQLQEKLQEALHRAEMQRKTQKQSATNPVFYTQVEEKEGNDSLNEDAVVNIKKKMALPIKNSPSPTRLNKKTSQFSANAIKMEQNEGEKRQYSGRSNPKEQIQMTHNKTYAKMGSALQEPGTTFKMSTESAVKKTIQINNGDLSYSSLPKNIRSVKVNNQIQKQIPKTLPKISNLISNVQLGVQMKQKSAVSEYSVRKDIKNTTSTKKDGKHESSDGGKQLARQQIIEEIVDISQQNNEFQNKKQQHQQLISEQLPSIHHQDISKTISQDLQINKKKEAARRYELEEQDEDLSAFHKSITIEKQNIASGKIKIDIPLIDIEKNIRKSEQLSKIKRINHNLNSAVIKEDEELPN